MQTTKVKMAVALVAVMVVLIFSAAVPTATKPTEKVETTTVTVAIPTPQPQVTEIAKVEEPPIEVEVKTVKTEAELYMEKVAKMMQDYREEPGSNNVKLDDATALNYATWYIEACEMYGEDVPTAVAMGWYESGFKWDEVSHCGAIGIMQLMPGDMKAEFGIDPRDLYDPEINIKTGVRYLSYLKDRYHLDTRAALMAYNKGIGNVLSQNMSRGGYERTVNKHGDTMRERIEN